jgi:hypothetical protein
MTNKISPELRARVTAMVEKYRQKELDFLDMLGRIDHHKSIPSKPRIRVKAISKRWSTEAPSQTGSTRKQ